MQFILALHMCAAAALAFYAAHQVVLLVLYLGAQRRGFTQKRAAHASEILPPVLVQLPLYNERFMARRIIEAVAAFDYPRDLLHIQVLDDSTDDTRDIVRDAANAARARNVDITVVQRNDRNGFKAGALAHGMALAPARDGELIAIFDADFIPAPDFLQRVLVECSAFANPRIGFVQTRWDFLNRDENIITRAQALVLDMHFVIEQTARSTAGLPMAFNGSGGLWRRTCIDDAGGWHDDTLTEDLDLSYRAEMRGWCGLYLPNERSPSDLPSDVLAYKRQQARWARGSLQTVRKLTTTLLRSPLQAHQKAAGIMHLTGYFVHPLILLTTLTTPLLLLHPTPTSGVAGSIGLLSAAPLLSMAIAAAARRRTPLQFVRDLPPALLLGIGVAFSNTVAMAHALRTHETGEFARTPKSASGTAHPYYRLRPDWTMWAEFSLALYAVGAVALLAWSGTWQLAAPVLFYAAGYGGVWAAQIRNSTSEVR